MVIARTRHDEYQYEGVKIVDIADWLLNEFPKNETLCLLEIISVFRKFK